MMRRLLLPVLVLVALVAGLVTDAVVADPGLPAAPQPAPALAAGSSTCAALGTEGGQTTTALALAGSVPAALADIPAAARLTTEQDGATVRGDDLATDGSLAVTPVGSELGDALVSLRWRTAPVVLGRSWRRPGADLVPPTLVEGVCPGAAATSWFVPGVATAGGAVATLHLANPFDGTATASVTFTTPSGPSSPTRLRNVVVPAHGQVELDLGTFAPEEPDLGVVVEVSAGRVVAEAVQVLQPAIGGVAGASHVMAHTAPAGTWTLPHVEVDETTSTWVWITNPGESAAAVRLVVHTTGGPTVPTDAGLVVAPGTTTRVDLGQFVPIGEPAAVTVRSEEDVPVLVSGAVVRVSADPARSGVAVVGAAAASADALVAPSAGGAGRTGFVAVTNPGTEAALVDVVAVTARGELPLDGLTGVRIAPGATVRLPTSSVSGLAHAIVVRPQEGAVVAALVGSTGDGDAVDPEQEGDGGEEGEASDDGDGGLGVDAPPTPQLDLTVTTAVAFPTLETATPLRSIQDPTLLSRIGTLLGPGADATSEATPDATTTPSPSPSPAP